MRMIVLGLAGLAACLAGSAADAAPLAVMPVKLLDTSGEAEDQTAVHNARLATMGDELTRDLSTGETEALLIPADEIAARCPDEAPQCLIDLAAASGAEQAVFAVVLKTSSLIMQLFVNVVDLTDGKVIAQRELSFRGDTDESWRRAEQFLVENLRKP